MTEAEWLSHDALWARLLQVVRPAATDRKLRLLACAACRLAEWPTHPDPRLLHAVETAERYADGVETLKALMAAGKAACRTRLWNDGPHSVAGRESDFQWLRHATRISGRRPGDFRQPLPSRRLPSDLVHAEHS